MPTSSDLLDAYSDFPPGLCGRGEPAQVIKTIMDPVDRIALLTLGVILDIKPLSHERWQSLTTLAGRWVLEPAVVAYKSSEEIAALPVFSGKTAARAWWQISRGIQGRYQGNWQSLFAECEQDAGKILAYLAKNKATFPVLSGPKVSVIWVDLLSRIGGVELSGCEALRVTIPANLRKSAAQFAISADKIHPQLLSALQTWSDSCRHLPSSTCALAACPNRGQ